MVKEFLKSVNICQSYEQIILLVFFESQCSHKYSTISRFYDSRCTVYTTVISAALCYLYMTHCIRVYFGEVVDCIIHFVSVATYY